MNHDDVFSAISNKFDVVEKTVKKGRGDYSITLAKFQGSALNRVLICKNNRSGYWVEMWFQSHEYVEAVNEKCGFKRFSAASAECGIWVLIKEPNDAVHFISECFEVSVDVEVTEQIEEFDRVDIERSAMEEMLSIEYEMYNGFWEVAKKLNKACGSIFHVDHASSIKKARKEAINHRNLQILVKGINTSKNSDSWERLTWEEQCHHILCVTSIIPNVEKNLVEFHLKQLELYWA